MKWIVIDTFDEKDRYTIIKDTDVYLVSPIKTDKQIIDVSGKTFIGNVVGEFITLHDAIAEVEEWLEKGE